MAYSTKPSRQEIRAKRERDIVRVCKERMGEKVDAMTEKHEQKRLKAISLEDEIIKRSDAGESETVISRLVDELNYVNQQAEFDDGTIGVFTAVRNVLLNLEVYLDALVEFEWYGYIIRTIPEKKLPKMLRSENQKDLVKVMEMTQKILEKIEDKIASTMMDKAEYEKTISKIKATAAEIKSRYTKDTKTNVNSAIEEIRRKRGLATKLNDPAFEQKEEETPAVNYNRA